jgi:hypothetical protein
MKRAKPSAWRRIHEWQYVLPPSRPSRYHLQIVKREIQGIKRDSPAAVLGSTPEFRDLLASLGFTQVYVIEKNSHVYTEMNALRCYSKPDILVLGDWLDILPRYERFFQLILSDLTSGNVSYVDQPRFYGAIANSLRKGGILVDKVLTHGRKKRTISKLMDRYSELPVNLLYTNYFSCEFLFCSELLDLRKIVDSSLFYSILRKRFKSEVLLRFLREAPRITPYGAIWFYGKEWRELKSNYYRHLELVHQYEEEPGSPYFGNLKILVTRSASKPK